MMISRSRRPVDEEDVGDKTADDVCEEQRYDRRRRYPGSLAARALQRDEAILACGLDGRLTDSESAGSRARHAALLKLNEHVKYQGVI